MIRIANRPIDGAVFDLDGVITDSACIHLAAWSELFNEVLGELGGNDFKAFTAQDYLRYVDGRSREEAIRSFLKSRDVELPVGDHRSTLCAHRVSTSGP